MAGHSQEERELAQEVEGHEHDDGRPGHGQVLDHDAMRSAGQGDELGEGGEVVAHHNQVGGL